MFPKHTVVVLANVFISTESKICKVEITWLFASSSTIFLASKLFTAFHLLETYSFVVLDLLFLGCIVH